MACSMAGSGADRKIRLPYPSLSHGASRSLTLTNIDGAMSMAIHNGADKTDSKSRRGVVSGLWDFSSMSHPALARYTRLRNVIVAKGL